MLTTVRAARLVVVAVAAATACAISAPTAVAAPSNDAFSAAEVLSGRETGASGTNDQATKEAGEPNHAGEPGGASIWYAWTAPAAGRTTVSTCASESVDTVLAVYTGASVNALSVVDANDNACGRQSTVSFTAVAGTTYRIAIDGVAGDTGPVEVDLRLAPPNDDFADAANLTGDTGSLGGLTIGASTEADEPEHSFGEGFPSVWYRWLAPSSGWATFETCGASYDSVLAVYTGSDLEQLVEVAANDDACGSSSRVSFEASAGTVYSIAVSGYLGRTGEFTLVWNRNAPPPEPPYATTYPSITGVARDGETLTAADGQWASKPADLARSGVGPLRPRLRPLRADSGCGLRVLPALEHRRRLALLRARHGDQRGGVDRRVLGHHAAGRGEPADERHGADGPRAGAAGLHPRHDGRRVERYGTAVARLSVAGL
jgi:hypothetical protein